jgi:hypothetical protein
MNSLDKAGETQLRNIQAKTGKTLAEMRAIIERICQPAAKEAVCNDWTGK